MPHLKPDENGCEMKIDVLIEHYWEKIEMRWRSLLGDTTGG
jgi:hypothetical protein